MVERRLAHAQPRRSNAYDATKRASYGNSGLLRADRSVRGKGNPIWWLEPVHSETYIHMHMCVAGTAF